MIVTVPDCLGVDTSARLTGAQYRALAASSWQGQPVRFVFRYVGLGGPAVGDISPSELAACLSAGLLLGLVQHVRLPRWVASEEQGRADGAQAAYDAKTAGYELGCHLGLDLEGCSSVGDPVIAHAEAWAMSVLDSGYVPLLYVGYACGLTPDQLYSSLGHISAYWSDFGPRSVSHRGFCCKQHPQTAIAGIPVDPDSATADALGGRLLLMGADPAPTDPAPAA